MSDSRQSARTADGLAAIAPAVGAKAALLRVRGLTVINRLRERPTAIVAGIDFDVDAGDTLAIVGESGSGKSITMRALVGLLPGGIEASGSAVFDGEEILGATERRLAHLRGRGISLLFQDPFTMLNPLKTAGEHIAETLRADDRRKFAGAELRDETIRRLREVGISDPTVAERYPFQLSGGMRQRVGIAAALAGDCRVLVADEPSTALDVTTQQEILALLKKLQRDRDMALVLITHNLGVAFSTCQRVAVLYAGTLIEVGASAALGAEPLHPYTLGLLLSDPPVDRKLSELYAIPGAVPQPGTVEGICPFVPRCAWAEEVCRRSRPALAAVGSGRLSACARIDAIRPAMRAMLRRIANAPEPAARRRQDRLVIEVRNLAKTFRNRRGAGGADVVALADVSLAVAENEVVAIVGESGSGKTTLGRCIVGLETASSGSILIEGLDAADFGRLPKDQRRRLRRTVQMIYQDPYSTLNPSWTIGATLREAIGIGESGRAKPEAAQDRLAELLRQVGLPLSYAGRKPAALSGGERQRVAIARALAVRPKVLVCDEPVSAVDVSVQAQILSLFRALQADLGMTFLFVTHDLAVARQVADRIYVMHKGAVVEHGAAADILDHPRQDYTRRLIASVPRADASVEPALLPAPITNRGRS